MLAAALKNAIAPAKPMSWAEAFLISAATLSVAIPAIAGAYLAKSALGIDLMPGPSPLHDLLYHLIV